MLTIPKDSKLYRREDYYIPCNEQAHNNGLPAVQTQRKMQKERSTQLNMILKGLIRERMIGCLMNEQVLKKDEQSQTYRPAESPLKRINRTMLIPLKSESSRCAKHDRERTTNSIHAKEDYHGSFISAVDVSRQPSIVSKKERPLSLNLPPIRISTVSINRNLWRQISVANKLKKDLFVKYVTERFGSHICNHLIRFFEPVFEGVFFRYRDFVESIARSNMIIQRFFMFQVHDWDTDGILSCEDLFKSLEMLNADIQEKQALQTEIYRIRQLIEKAGNKPGIAKGQSLLEYLSLNHSLTLAEVNQILDEQHRPFLESNIKKFTGYQHTFLVTEHNEDIRMLKHRAEQIKINMEKDVVRKRAGLPFDTFVEHPEPILQKIIDALCGKEFPT